LSRPENKFFKSFVHKQSADMNVTLPGLNRDFVASRNHPQIRRTHKCGVAKK